MGLIFEAWITLIANSLHKFLISFFNFISPSKYYYETIEFFLLDVLRTGSMYSSVVSQSSWW